MVGWGKGSGSGRETIERVTSFLFSFQKHELLHFTQFAWWFWHCTFCVTSPYLVWWRFHLQRSWTLLQDNKIERQDEMTLSLISTSKQERERSQGLIGGWLNPWQITEATLISASQISIQLHTLSQCRVTQPSMAYGPTLNTTMRGTVLIRRVGCAKHDFSHLGKVLQRIGKLHNNRMFSSCGATGTKYPASLWLASLNGRLQVH